MKLLPHALLDELTARAEASERRRAHYNIHAGPSDLVQRFVVVALRDSYFRPHRHAARAELALILRGEVEIVTFDASGQLTARYAVGAGSANLAYETPPATWHTVVVKSASAAFLEIKQGPYDPATASQFAEWAPAEGEPAVHAFQRWLQHAPLPRDSKTPPAHPSA
jgi:cupin fold WbuC family metalloprotein